MSDYIFEYYQNNKNYKKIYTGCPIKIVSFGEFWYTFHYFIKV